MFKRLAMEQGIPEENVLMPELGAILDFGVQRPACTARCRTARCWSMASPSAR